MDLSHWPIEVLKKLFAIYKYIIEKEDFFLFFCMMTFGDIGNTVLILFQK